MRHTPLISRALQAAACASVFALAGCGGGSDPDASAPKPESSEKTVIHHITSICMALGLELDDDSHRRVQAVLAYLSSR